MKQQSRPILLLVILALFLVSSPALTAQESPETFEDITDAVTEIRGLESSQPIDVMPMTREELRVDLEQDLLEDYPPDEVYADERELIAFGLMDPDVDLGQLIVDLYSEQVAGFYDTETGELVVVRGATEGDGFTPSEEVTYAHEIVHALQDQNFDLDAGPLNREDVTDDHSYAITALIEGDATHSEILYLIANPELLEGFLEEVEAMEFDTEVLDSAPPIISETLYFPYEHGYPFVETIYNEGGWEAVNAAFADPPTSTEQILHPEKYLAGEEPTIIDVPDFTPELEGEWTVFDDNSFGEFQIRVILQGTSMSDAQAVRAAAGWNGDTYVVAGTETEDAIHWVSEWETDQDASEFARSWALYETERWGVSPEYISANVMQFEADGVVSRIVLDGTTVTYLMAPSVELLETIADSSPATPQATPAA